MKHLFNNTSHPGNRGARMRVLLFIMALAAILPSVLVLWFMSLAIENEQLARRQMQSEALQGRFNSIKNELFEEWQQYLRNIQNNIESQLPAKAFYETTINAGADGLLVLQPGQSNEIVYPDRPLPQRIEDEKQRRLLRNVDDQFSRLRDIQQAGDQDAARGLAEAILISDGIEKLVDESGRHFLTNFELYLAEHQELLNPEQRQSAIADLVARLNDYEHNQLTSAQRRFVMDRLIKLNAVKRNSGELNVGVNENVFPTYATEQRSARFAQAYVNISLDDIITRGEEPGFWYLGLGVTNPERRHGVLIFHQDSIIRLFTQWIAQMEFPPGTTITLHPSMVVSEASPDQYVQTFHAAFPGWSLRLNIDSSVYMPESVTTLYVIVSIGSVVFIIAALVLIARLTMRKMELAQQKNTMVATVSHELRTPVSSIQVLLDNLMKGPTFDPTRAKEYLSLIAKENARLGQLIENFLSFSRIERQQFKLNKEPIDLPELVKEVGATFCQQNDIGADEFHIEMAPYLPPYFGDYWAIARSILNLLDNAYKYSDPPRKIILSVSSTTWNLIFSVSDNGIGIREQDQEKIFRQFFQVDQKLSRVAEGCGLGLCIVQHIVQQHGGRVALESQLGRGSKFTITLPLKTL